MVPLPSTVCTFIRRMTMVLTRKNRSRCVARAVSDPATNLRLVAVPAQGWSQSKLDNAGTGTYLVRDGEGQVHDTGVIERREALRCLGTFMFRGFAAPLILLDPLGRPTGDRLG